jgi:hypothetical protein
MLKPVDRDVWIAESSVRFLGSRLPTRMTVLRLRSGDLFVHSPVPIDGNLRAEIDPLGPVRFVVAPSKYHHLGVAPWFREYPGARVWAAPGLPEKRHDLSFHGLLSEQAPAEWGDEIQQTVFWSLPMLNEVIFCHRASRTLILTDLVFNIHEHDSALVRLGLRIDGAWRRFGASHLLRLLIRDRRRGRETIQQILSWDFDRVIMSHGRILETGGRDAVRDAFAFL